MEQGKKRVENTGGHRRTFPGVSRMRYHPALCKRLKLDQKRLEAFSFLADIHLYSNASFAGILSRLSIFYNTFLYMPGE
jgi:hypothetical protein